MNEYKIVILGNRYVGKSSLIKRYIDGTFSNDQFFCMVQGVRVNSKTINYNDQSIKLNLYDISGAERFGGISLVQSHCIGAVGAIIMFDITRLGTFDGVKMWKKILDEVAPTIPTILLANKFDIFGEIHGDHFDSLYEVINSNNLSKFCKDNEIIESFDTSAKNNINIDGAMNFLVNCIIGSMVTNDNENNNDNDDCNSEIHICI